MKPRNRETAAGVCAALRGIIEVLRDHPDSPEAPALRESAKNFEGRLREELKDWEAREPSPLRERNIGFILVTLSELPGGVSKTMQ
jgi:hypothetical protein